MGVGLIGGSLARDFKRLLPDAEIYGIDSSKNHLEEAVGLGIIDHSAGLEDLHKADLVIVAVPVDQANLFLPPVLDAVGNETLVIDVGSTKNSVCEAVATHDKRRNFLAAHPISGTEFSGPSAAIEYLFSGKTMIICEVEKTAFKLQEKVLSLFNALGMRLRYMDPQSHDKHIAYVSHLSHISSFMLGKTVMEKEKTRKTSLIWPGVVLPLRCAWPRATQPRGRPFSEKIKRTCSRRFQNIYIISTALRIFLKQTIMRLFITK